MNTKNSKLKIIIKLPIAFLQKHLKLLVLIPFLLPIGLFAQDPNSPCEPGDLGSGQGPIVFLVPDGSPGTVIWDETGGDQVIAGDFEIPSGITLVIRDISVFFTDQTRIVVQNGAHLILDNALLTVYCNELLWEGIQVWGDQTKPHPKTVSFNYNTNSSLIISDGDSSTNDDRDHHGVVYMKNNSRIEHARAGIHTMKFDNWDPDYPSQGKDYSQSNGIVIAAVSSFYNNLCSIILQGDNNQTSSRIDFVQFISDEDFHAGSISDPGNLDPDVQLYFKNVVGLKINYAQFAALDPTTNGYDAIVCYDSTFDYFGSGTNPFFKSSISNYERGIQAFYSLNNQKTQTKVENVEFDNTPFPMGFSGFKNLIDNGDGVIDRADLALYLYNNTINLPIAYNQYNDPNPQPPFSGHYAIELESCDDYIVSKNEIFGGYANGGNTLYDAIGVSESENVAGSLPVNYIQRNVIGNGNSAFFKGIYAFDDNPTLQILCNTFFDGSTAADIVFHKRNGTKTPAAPMQGGCDPLDTDNPEKSPAGNIFSTSIQTFEDSGYNIVYNHVNLNEPQHFGNIIPNECTYISSVDCDAYTNGLFAQEEEDNSGGGTPQSAGCSIAAFRTGYMEIEKEMQGAMDLLTKYNRKDESTSIGFATNIKDVLGSIEKYDVYLSDGELEAVIAKLTAETAGDVINILEENAPVNTAVLQALTNHINTLSLKEQLSLSKNYGARINNLYENTKGMSLRNAKESEVYQLSIAQRAYLPQLGSLSCSKISPSEVLSELNYAINNTSINKVWFQQVLVDYAVSQGLYSEAKEALSQINTKDNEDLADYVAVQKFFINMQQEDKSLDDLNEKEIEQLENIANTNTASGISARNAILAIRDSIPTYYTPDISLEKDIEKPAKPVNPLLSLRISNDNKLVYPIPAKDVLFVNTNLLNIHDEEIAVNIYNLNGVLVESAKANTLNNNSIDVSKISQGAYFVELIIDGNELIERSKVLIIK